ncbi:trans-sialidase [Trypanosoma cruzi]|nr:trans-sialidase [Trypanosoma cruzi]
MPHCGGRRSSCGTRRRRANEKRPTLGEGRQMSPHACMRDDGVSTRPHQPHRLMAGGVPASTFPQRTLTGERRRVNTQTSQGNVGRPHLPHSMPLPSRASPLEDDSGPENQLLHFLAFGLTTWVPRIWNEDVSGVLLVDPRCAYSYYWH